MNATNPSGVVHHVAPPMPAEPPLRARQYGHAGLIPFIVGTLLLWLVYPDLQPWVALGLAAYGALIVAFLGGIHWGLAMDSHASGQRAFGWAMVPPLVAWLALVMPAHAGRPAWAGMPRASQATSGGTMAQPKARCPLACASMASPQWMPPRQATISAP